MAEPIEPTTHSTRPRHAGLDLQHTLTALAILGLLAAAVVMLLPAVQSTPTHRRRHPCANNLKQIGLALHNYHAAYGCIPPAYVTGKDGEPLYSWRVLILPYMEQQPLYDALHLDEPWDSPHNRALADRTPAVPRRAQSAGFGELIVDRSGASSF